MTTYGAYNKGLPCKNQNCKSHGRSHPNCKCYPELLAEGGEVKFHCEGPHKKECEYYAEGGQVEEEIPTIENTMPIDAAEEEVPTIENTTPIDSGIFDEIPTMENTMPMDGSEEEPTMENTVGEYETGGQKLLTAIEGAGEGLLGPVATGVELGLSKLGVPGLSAEDIKARQAANPGIHGSAEAAGTIAGFLPFLAPVSLAGKIGKVSKLVKIAEGASNGAKLGSAALKGAIQGGLLQTSDEMSKAMLGYGDPEEPVAAKLVEAGGNIFWAGLGGAGFGAAGEKGSQLLSKAAESKIGTRLYSLLSGIGETANGILPENSYARFLNEKSYNVGKKIWEDKINAITGGLALGEITYDVNKMLDTGNYSDGISEIGMDVLKYSGFKLVGTKLVEKYSKPIGSAIMRSITNGEHNPRAIFQIMNDANKIGSGAQKINHAVQNVFTVGAQKIFNEADLQKKRDKLDEYLSNGGITEDINQEAYKQNGLGESQGFAKGGQVPTPERDYVAENFPEQNMLISAAKARISNYLNGLRPQKDEAKMMFDREPDQKQKKKKYNKALDMAIQPLSILDKIRNGTIELEDAQNFNAMHPELNNVLQRKLTQSLLKEQLAGKKPNYKTRIGLSLFMGANLSSEFSPTSIMAAQAVFKKQLASQQPAQGAAPKKTSALSKTSESFLTRNQAAAGRQQDQR